MANTSDLISEADARNAEAIIKSIRDAQANGTRWVNPVDQTDGFPSNPTTGRTYGGSYNGLILLIMSSHYGDSRWAGFGQWKKKGNTPKKGERGTAIFFPIPYLLNLHVLWPMLKPTNGSIFWGWHLF